MFCYDCYQGRYQLIFGLGDKMIVTWCCT